MKSPCYKCEERFLGCHSICESYRDFQKFCDTISEKRRNDTKEFYNELDYHHRAYKRVVNYRRRKK